MEIKKIERMTEQDERELEALVAVLSARKEMPKAGANILKPGVIGSAEHVLFVYRDKGVIKGFATAARHERTLPVAHSERTGVDPGYRKKGVGTALFKAKLEWLFSDARVKAVQAAAESGHGIKLLKAAGFRPEKGWSKAVLTRERFLERKGRRG